MKKQILNSLTTAFFLSLMIFISCGGDDGGSTPSPEEVQFEKIAKTWTSSNVTADNQPVDGWTGFTVTFTGTAESGSYSTGGSQPDGTDKVWPAAGGNWSFGDNVNTIVRSDNVSMGLTVNADGTQATLTFEVTDNGGRTDIVEGSWRFDFTATN